MIHNAPLEATCLLLDKIISVNYGKHANTSYKYNNPLLYCCTVGQLDFVKLLIENYGADIEFTNSCGMSAIMVSAKKNHLNFVRYLYNRGAKTVTLTSNIKDYYKGVEKMIQMWDTEKSSNCEQIMINSY